MNLKKKFSANMTFENYGKVWEIDHKMPLRDFDITNKKELRIVNSLDNIRPLEISVNRGWK